MKKIKSLFVALIASFGMLTTLAGGLGIYINDVEVGAGSPPKDCGWTHKKSADIMPCPKIPTWRENENVITFTKPGEYAISGSNSTDHVQIVIDADCTLVLENLYLIANKMHIAYSKDALALAISEYTRVYPAVTVNPKRHATIALWGEKVRLRGSMTHGDIVVAPNASVVLDDWDGGTVKTGTISIFNQGTLTVESRCSSDIYCNNAGVLNHYGSGALWYDHRTFYWDVPKNAKYGKYIETWAISQYEEFNERCGLEHVTPELPDSTLYSVECTGGTLNKRSGGALYGYQKGMPIHTKSIYYGGGSFNVESIGDGKDGNMADCSMSATEEIVIAGGSIEVMRRIYAGKRILITGGNVMAGGCITAPEVRISGGEVSANGEWGKYQWIIRLSDYKYSIDTVASSHLPAIGRDRGLVEISGGTVRANLWEVPLDHSAKLYVNEWSEYPLTYEWKRRGCAGIGGNNTTVLITGGTITAFGGGEETDDVELQMSGAAIGGGYGQCCGLIRITGAKSTPREGNIRVA